MPIFYTDLYGNSSSGATEMVGANATANTDGVAGLVPAPLAPNAAQFLRGDGTWAPVATGPAEMVGATGSADGTSGLVPGPLSANVSQFLRGDGTWATAAPQMVGANASANTAGTSGTVPAPAVANATQFLRGDATWAGPSLVPDTTGGGTLSFNSIYHKRSVSSAQAFTFAGLVDGAAQSLNLELNLLSGGSVTWPAEVKWPNGVAPTLATGKTHLFVFSASNATTIYAASILNY